MKEYARSEGDTGSPEVQVASPYSKNSGTDRASYRHITKIIIPDAVC